MNEECQCPCHNRGVFMMHIAPCCATCNECGRHIRFEFIDAHEQKCKSRVQSWQEHIIHDLADIEDVLVEALVFYAAAENWEGLQPKALADGGEVARHALEKLC